MPKIWVTPTFQEWGILLGVGVFVFLAQTCLTYAYHLEKASKVSLINYLGIIIALGIGYFFFAEVPSTEAVFGMLLIACGVSVGSQFHFLKNLYAKLFGRA